MVDTQRAVPSEESGRPVRPKAVCQSVRKADNRYHLFFTTLGTD